MATMMVTSESETVCVQSAESAAPDEWTDGDKSPTAKVAAAVDNVANNVGVYLCQWQWAHKHTNTNAHTNRLDGKVGEQGRKTERERRRQEDGRCAQLIGQSAITITTALVAGDCQWPVCLSVSAWGVIAAV